MNNKVLEITFDDGTPDSSIYEITEEIQKLLFDFCLIASIERKDVKNDEDIFKGS